MAALVYEMSPKRVDSWGLNPNWRSFAGSRDRTPVHGDNHLNR
jgi:hypothetical protein